MYAFFFEMELLNGSVGQSLKGSTNVHLCFQTESLNGSVWQGLNTHSCHSQTAVLSPQDCQLPFILHTVEPHYKEVGYNKTRL